MKTIFIITPCYNSNKQDVLKVINSSIECFSQYFDQVVNVIVDDYSDAEKINHISVATETLNNVYFLKSKVNSGPGVARNIGLNFIANNFDSDEKYITFCDSDDTFINIELELQCDKELYTFGYKKNKKRVGCTEIKTISSFHNGLFLRISSLIYKYDKFEKLRFSNYRIGEDSDFIINILVECDDNKWVHTGKPVAQYNYDGKIHICSSHPFLDLSYDFLKKKHPEKEPFLTAMKVKIEDRIIDFQFLEKKMKNINFIDINLKRGLYFLLGKKILRKMSMLKVRLEK